MGSTYHRAYRFVGAPAVSVGWSILAALIPGLALVCAAPWLLRFHGQWVTALLLWIGVPTIEHASGFGLLPMVVPEVSTWAPHHSFYPAVMAIAGCAIALLLLVRYTRLTPVRVVIGVAAMACGVSGIYFYFAGDRFPYDTAEFSALWTRAEFVVWLIVPILMAMVLGPLPLRPRMTLLYSAMTVLYAIWFSVIRLTLLLTWFHVAGLIWLPPAYFTAGFLADFLYIVGFYSIAISRTARNLRARSEVWQW